MCAGCGQTPSLCEMIQLRKQLAEDEMGTREVGWKVGMVSCMSDSVGPAFFGGRSRVDLARFCDPPRCRCSSRGLFALLWLPIALLSRGQKEVYLLPVDIFYLMGQLSL